MKKWKVEETYLYLWVSISLRSSAMASFRSLFGSIPLGVSLFACRLSLLTNSTSTSSSWYDSVRVYSRSWNSNTASFQPVVRYQSNEKKYIYTVFYTAKYRGICIFMKGNKRALREFINVSFRFTWRAQYVDYVRDIIYFLFLPMSGFKRCTSFPNICHIYRDRIHTWSSKLFQFCKWCNKNYFTSFSFYVSHSQA